MRSASWTRMFSSVLFSSFEIAFIQTFRANCVFCCVGYKMQQSPKKKRGGRAFQIKICVILLRSYIFFLDCWRGRDLFISFQTCLKQFFLVSSYFLSSTFLSFLHLFFLKVLCVCVCETEILLYIPSIRSPRCLFFYSPSTPKALKKRAAAINSAPARLPCPPPPQREINFSMPFWLWNHLFSSFWGAFAFCFSSADLIAIGKH